MEVPDKTLDLILTKMARSDLDNEMPTESEIEKGKSKSPPNHKPKRKHVTLLASPTTVLFSKEGKYKAIVRALPSYDTDGYCFKVIQTGKIFDSERMAIRNARSWLKKKRIKYYKKHPSKRPRVKTTRIIPKKEKSSFKTINKLYKMNIEVAKILVRMSERKLKLHKKYSRKKWDSKKTSAVSGDTKDFNVAIYNVMLDGTKKERKVVAKMLREFTHEPYRKTNMFY